MEKVGKIPTSVVLLGALLIVFGILFGRGGFALSRMQRGVIEPLAAGGTVFATVIWGENWFGVLAVDVGWLLIVAGIGLNIGIVIGLTRAKKARGIS